MSVVSAATRVVISDLAQVAGAAEALATEGAVVAHAFANFYVITTRGDADTVRRVNVMKGRPPGQVGSITGPPASLPEVWDLDGCPSRCPAGPPWPWSTPSTAGDHSASAPPPRPASRPTSARPTTAS
jgi:hypothetical protein